MDVCVTVPFKLWSSWIAEGDLPGDPWSGDDSHFWISRIPKKITIGSRVYVNAGRVIRGYAPLVGIERACILKLDRACLVRQGGAVAMTLMCPGPVEGAEQLCYGPPRWCQERGFQLGNPHPAYLQPFRGYRYRWWDRDREAPFPGWRNHIERA